MEQLRKHMDYGFISVSGGQWSDSAVDRYNFDQDRINAFIMAGRPVPDYLVNGSFHLFCSYDRAFATN